MDKIKSFLVKYKRSLIVAAVVLLLASGVVYYKATAWERDVVVKYTGYEDNPFSKEDTIYLYEVTNSTNRTLREVTLVFECKAYVGKKWTYEEGGNKLFDTLGPGESKTFKVSRQRMKDAKGGSSLFYDYGLKKIKYKK